MAEKRKRQKLDTRERVRRAAAELFEAHGFDATTTKAIAERAGVAAGTVFVHAGDKDDLLFLVMHDHLERTLAERFASLPDAPLVDRLMHVFAGLHAMYERHPVSGREFVRRVTGARGPNATRVTALTFDFFAKLAALVDDAKARGEVAHDVPATLAAQNFFAAYLMTIFAWADGHAPLTGVLDAALRASLALQVRGLHAR